MANRVPKNIKKNSANTIFVKYLVFAVIFLHISALTLVIRVRVTCSDEFLQIKAKLFFIPVVNKKIEFSKLIRQKNDGERVKTEAEKSKPPSAATLGIARRIISRTIAQRFDLVGSLGLSDAAATAYAAGTIGIVYTQACAFLCYDRLNESGITPVYDYPHADLTFDGIFCISFADIIVAVCDVRHRFERTGASKRSENGYYIAE